MDVTLIFNVGSNNIIVQCSSNDKMSDIFTKFISKLNIQANINDFEYRYNQKELSDESTLANNIKIGSDKIISINVKRRVRMYKCPECICNDCIINLLNYQLSFYGCKYDKTDDENSKHKRVTIYGNYANIQNMDYSQIRCHTPGCTNSPFNSNDFYKCLTCSKRDNRSKYFCDKCIPKHKEINDKIVKFDEKNYYCQNHFKSFEKYCFDCKKDLCKDCEKEHITHKIVYYSELTTDIITLKNVLGNIKENVNKLSFAIDNIKDMLDGTKRIYEKYYNIANDIIKKYELFNKDLKNYRILRTIRNLKFSNNQIIDDLNKMIDERDLEKKSSIILSTYINITSNYINKLDQVKGTGNKQHISSIKKETDDNWYEEICQIRDKKKNDPKKIDSCKKNVTQTIKHKNK